MDARTLRLFARLVILIGAGWSLGASARTEHFIVSAPTPQIAQQVATAAENFRRDLAMEWLGAELPQWADKCPIRVVLNRPAAGETSFEFPAGGGHPRRWRMTVEGSLERILDSVLPHEILHTVFATHFKNPLPRWADEGACTTVEGRTEKSKHDYMLIQFLQGEDGIPFNEMFQMREYPRKILPLYSQGYSVASYLIAQGGRQKFVKYVGHGMRTNNWTDATRRFYGYSSLSDLQVKWVAWVAKGSDPMKVRPAERLVSESSLAAGNAQVSADAPASAGQVAAITQSPSAGSRPQAGRSAPAASPASAASAEGPAGRLAQGPGPGRMSQPRRLPDNQAAAPLAPRGAGQAPATPNPRALTVMKDSGWYVRQARNSQRQSKAVAATTPRSRKPTASPPERTPNSNAGRTIHARRNWSRAPTGTLLR